jgi:type IV pilus modification protein PilV
MPRTTLIPAPPVAQQGFSMLEILITLVIVATALFGTAGLQTYALLVGKDGQNRTQAIFLATDLLDRIEANKSSITGSVAGNYIFAGSGVPAALTLPDPCMS